ncbi:MAG: hypothetical protein ACI802_001880, partial [Candidatus Paceibacteria bacterium]
YFKFFTSNNFVLLATGFYDRVHMKPHQLLRDFFSLNSLHETQNATRGFGKTANHT